LNSLQCRDIVNHAPGFPIDEIVRGIPDALNSRVLI
jgi:hypothetical protein